MSRILVQKRFMVRYTSFMANNVANYVARKRKVEGLTFIMCRERESLKVSIRSINSITNGFQVQQTRMLKYFSTMVESTS